MSPKPISKQPVETDLTEHVAPSNPNATMGTASPMRETRAPEPRTSARASAANPADEKEASTSSSQEEEKAPRPGLQAEREEPEMSNQGKEEATEHFSRSSDLKDLLDFKEAEAQVQILLEIWVTSQPLFMVRGSSLCFQWYVGAVWLRILILMCFLLGFGQAPRCTNQGHSPD